MEKEITKIHKNYPGNQDLQEAREKINELIDMVNKMIPFCMGLEKTDQYKCPSYFDNDLLKDCNCGKCA